MLGGRSPESAHGVARVVVPAFRQVNLMGFDELAHMRPITHPDVVNTAIHLFLKSI